MKILIITQYDAFYLPVYLEKICAKLKGRNINIQEVVIVPLLLPKKNYLQTLLHYLLFLGPLIFALLFFVRIWYAVQDTWSLAMKKRGAQFHSMALVAKNHGIPVRKQRSVTDDVFRSHVTGLKPDVVLSLSCTQIIPKSLLSIPPKGAINVHSSLLPRYRGFNPYFWVLARGEQMTGVTVHFMDKSIDTGDIIVQEKISIKESWSLHDLYLNAIDVGSDAVVRALSLIEEGKVTPTKQNMNKSSYLSVPTRKDVKEFKVRGKRFFRFSSFLIPSHDNVFSNFFQGKTKNTLTAHDETPF